MKQDKHTLTYKKFIKAEKRLNAIWKEQGALPYTPCEPYQNGWVLIPVLREDYLRSSNGPIVKPLLDKLGVSTTTRNAKEITQIRKKPALSAVRSMYNNTRRYYTPPSIKNISQKEYDKLTEQQRKYFSITPYIFDNWKKNYPYYLDIPEHYLVVKVEKNIITRKKEIDPLLLQEEDELRKILAPYWRSSGYYDWRDDYDNKSKRRQSKVNIQKLMEEEL